MRILLHLLYLSYIQLCSPFPVEEKPGFTIWPLEKRDLTPISELQFSGVSGVQLGISEKSHFGVPDPTCRGKLPGGAGDKCWSMDQFTLDDLHDPKYYPDKDNLDRTPEVKCAYKDTEDLDVTEHFNGCQRLYFMSMPKAMASECSGEVFVMTMTDLKNDQHVPTNGIWWEVEFPTLIDPNRAENKKVTKITYIQVPFKDANDFKKLRETLQDDREPPEELFREEYWPNGPGKKQLDDPTPQGSNPGNPQQKRSLSISGHEGESQQNGNHTTSDYQGDAQVKRSYSTSGFVKRADRKGGEICTYGEDCYPYPYPIENMYDWYNKATW